jgi:hypothetical protein
MAQERFRHHAFAPRFETRRPRVIRRQPDERGGEHNHYDNCDAEKDWDLFHGALRESDCVRAESRTAKLRSAAILHMDENAEANSLKLP